MHEEANNQRMGAMAREVLGPDAETFIAAESWGAVATHLAKAEHDGWNPAALLHTAAGEREFDSAHDQSAVLAWRVETMMAKAPELLARAGQRPLQGLTDDQLSQLRRDAETAAHTPHTAAATEGPRPADHWTNRRYGRLPDAELERLIFTTRFSAREQSSINDPAVTRRAHQQLRALQEEQRIRTEQLKAPQKTAEAAKRGPPPNTAPTTPPQPPRCKGPASTRSSPPVPEQKNASGHPPPSCLLYTAGTGRTAGVDRAYPCHDEHLPAAAMARRTRRTPRSPDRTVR